MNDILHRIKNNCRYLTTLDLSNKNISDKFVLQLANALKTNTRLKKLNLCNNPIGDVSRFALAEAIKGKSIKLLFVKNFIVVGNDTNCMYHIYL
jgi:Ran GTPase-activating protein (RanGAP) involved in mRNA processing and transport